MPELPSIVVYIGERLEGVRLTSPFVLHSVEPPIDTIVGRTFRESGHVFRIAHEHTSAPLGFEDSKGILTRSLKS